MKKLLKIVSVALTGAMLLSTVPAVSVSAATKKATISTENTSKGLKLSWKKSGKNTKYTISRSTKKSSGYKTLKTTNKLTYTDKTAKKGKTYYYRVKLSTGKNYNAVKATRLQGPAVKSVTLTKYDSIKITWSKVAGAQKYKVYRAKANYKNGKYIYQFSTKKTSATDYLSSSGRYSYKVTAVNGNSESIKRAAKKIDYLVPSYVTPTVTTERTGINLDFTLIKNVDGYKIYRYEENKKSSTLKTLATIKASQVKTNTDMFGEKVGQYLDTTTEFGKTYVYGIQTYKGKVNSSISYYELGIKYTEADFILNVGEQNSDFSDVIKGLNVLFGEEVMSYIKITYTTDDKTIATIDDNGVITGVAPGKTIVNIIISANIEGMTTSETIKGLVLVKGSATPSQPENSTPEAPENTNPSEPENSENTNPI